MPTPVIDPHQVETMMARFASSPLNRFMGLRLEEVGEGTATVALTVKTEFYNPLGIVHGGVIATGLDSALLQAVRSRCGEGDQQTTIEMKINYLEAAKSDRLCFRGAALRVGRRIGVAQAEALDGAGNLVAVALGTVAVHRAG